MTRKEALSRELQLKSELKRAGVSEEKSAKTREELDKVREVIGTRSLEEAYGAMAY